MTAVMDATRLQLGAWRWIAVGWLILALSFGVNLAVATLGDATFTSGGMLVVLVFAAVMSSALVGSWWPFAAGLGVTRAHFFRANLLVGLAVGAATGLALLVLAVIEAATDGWGSSLVYFGVLTPWVSGPFQEWLILAGAYLLAWVVGLLFAVVHKRWGAVGTTIGCGLAVVLPGALLTAATMLPGWPGFSRWVDAQTVAGMLVGWALATAVIALASWLVLRRTAP